MNDNTSPPMTASPRISPKRVLLFMKGTPVFPQCGFSAAVVQVLSQLGVKFKSWTC